MRLPRTFQVLAKTKSEGLRITGSERLRKTWEKCQNDSFRKRYLPNRVLECKFEGEKMYGNRHAELSAVMNVGIRAKNSILC